MPRQSAKRKPLDREERRENAWRPCPYLGYDRDDLGMFLMGREAFAIAETQFRRAAWLNPFEPIFRVHLAWCLYKQGKGLAEAVELIETVLREHPEHGDAQKIRDLLIRAQETHA